MSFSRFLTYLLLLLATLMPACGGKEESVGERMASLQEKEYEPAAYWEGFDEAAEEVRAMLQKEAEVDLGGIPFRMADRPAMASAFASNLQRQLHLIELEEEELESLGEMLSVALLGIYDISAKEVLVCKENFPFLADLVSMPDLDALDCLKALMAHEGSHAVADLKWGLAETIEELEDDQQLEALSAVIEGYAQYMARKVCTENGLKDGFETFTTAVGASPETDDPVERLAMEAATATFSFQYYEGEDFVRAIVAARGEAAIGDLFTAPPRNATMIAKPEWYLDPSKIEEGSFDLPELLTTFEETTAAPGRSPNQVEMNLAAFRAAMAPLSEEVIDGILALVVKNRMSVAVEAGGEVTALVIYECRSDADAASMAGYSEQLLRARDEAFKEGPTRITAASYTEFEASGWKGVRSVKTVAMPGGSLDATTFIAHRGVLSTELTIAGHGVDVELIEKAYAALTEHAFDAAR